MTQSAMEFITPLTLQALSGNPVHTDLFDVEAEAAMGHIELAKWADVIVVAPATANTIAKIAHGRADNLLTTLVLASKAKLYIAPAMNQAMWANPQTTANIKQLEQNEITLLGPGAGEQACGDVGLGRMLEPAEIVDQIIAESTTTPSLQGVSVLITAGPTREALDPVRYLTNRSSGKMGYAIAEAAKKQGAQVTLVSGPVHLDTPTNIEAIYVESAQEMFSAVRKHAKQADIFIACAAVADFSPATISNHKIKKNSDTEILELTLTKNPDILAETSHAHPNLFTVGFAAETTDLEKYAKGKLISKKLNMIAANKVGKNQGFDKDDNALLVLWEEGKSALPLTSKDILSQQLIQLISDRFEIYKHHLPSNTPTNTHDEQDV